MSETEQNFVVEMLRRIQADLAELRRDMTTLQVRQTAAEHFEQGLMALVGSIHASIDEIKADMRVVNGASIWWTHSHAR